MKSIIFCLLIAFLGNSCTSPAKSYRNSKNEPLVVRVKKALAAEEKVSRFPLTINQRGQTIILSGVVDTTEQKQIAEQTVNEVYGVKDVENHLFVRNPLGGESL